VRTWDGDESGRILRFSCQKGQFLAFHFDMADSAISISHHSSRDWQDVLSVLLGPALGAALHLRNITCLHGSAVLLAGGAVLFAGDANAGKSTLTATLANHGQPLICDELAALTLDDGGVFVQPGHPLLKLSPQSLHAMGQSPCRFPYVFPSYKVMEERWVDARALPGGVHQTTVPLKMVYLLAGRGREIRRPRILPLPPTEACFSLCKHLYGREWLHAPPEEAMRLCALIAATTPVRQVWVPEGLDSLRDSIKALMEDALSPTPEPSIP
jgi:hypothetical protein